MLNLSRIKIILGNIAYLFTGNTLSMVLGFVFNIYMAKLLGAEAFGLFNTVDAYVAMFGVFVFEGYQKVAVRECCSELEKLQQVIEGILGIRILLSLLGIVCATASAVAFGYGRTTTFFIAVFSFTLLFGSVSSMLYVVYHAHSKMKYIALASLFKRLVHILPAALCIWIRPEVQYVVYTFVLAALAEVFFNLAVIRRVFSLTFSLKRCFIPFDINRKHFKEAFVFTLLGFIGYFHRPIDIAMLSWMTSLADVGAYAAATKLTLPFQMLGRMAKVAFFPQFIDTFKAEKQIPASALFKITGMIAAVMIPPAVIISLYSRQIIQITFGSEFAASAPVLAVLCWMIPFSLIFLPFSVAVQANHHEAKLILPNILRSLSNVVLNFIFIRTYGLMGAVYSTIITYTWYHLLVAFGYQYYLLKKGGQIR